MANETLEKNQEKNTDIKIAEYSFMCSGAGTESTEKPIITSEKEKIRLHLLRYAFFPVELECEKVSKADDYTFEEVVLSRNLPKLDKFKKGSTYLNPGYVYIFDEDNPDNHQEYEVNEFGNFSKILWKDNKDEEGNYLDIRKPSNIKYDDCIPINHDVKTVYIIYSRLQWSVDYHNKIAQLDREAKKILTKVKCEPRLKEDKLNENIFYDQVFGTFTEYDTYHRNLFNTKLDNIESFYKDAEEIYDIFVSLQDPIAMAQDIANRLRKLWIDMDALMISLKTGVSTTDVLECLMNKKDPKTLQNAEDLKQIEALYNIAVNVKQAAFANEENIEKIGEKIDAERLATVLATNERLELKKEIASARTDLIAYLNSGFFKTYEDLFINNIQDRVAYLKSIFGNLISDLLKPANAKDVFIETKDEAKRWIVNTEKGEEFCKDILFGRNTLGVVFNQMTVLERIEEESKYLDAFSIVDSMLEFSSLLVENGDEILEQWVKVMNKVRIKINGELQEAIFEITTLGKEFRKSDIGRSEFVKKCLNINKKSIKQFNKALRKMNNELNDVLKAKQLALARGFEKAIESDVLSGIHNFKSNALWSKLLRNLSFINLGLATIALRKRENRAWFGLGVLKFMTAIGDVYVATRSVKEIKLSSQMTIQAFERYSINSVKATRIMGYATALVDAVEAGLNFWERDYDAAMAYASASGLTIIGFFLLSSGVAASWNPLGWILIFAGAIVGFYATFLEDTPLERYAKNGVFGEIPNKWLFWDKVTFEGDYLAQIKQHVLPKVRDDLHKTGFSDWEDYPKQYEILMDILSGGRIKYTINDETEISDSVISTTEISEGGMDAKPFLQTTTYMCTINLITINVTFGGYLTHKDLLKYKILYLPNGFSGSTYQDVTNTNGVLQDIIEIPYNDDDQKPPSISLILNTKSFIPNEESMFLVLCRVNINNSQFFPIPRNNEKRYLATAFPHIRTNRKIGLYITDGVSDTVITGTENELINLQKWIK